MFVWSFWLCCCLHAASCCCFCNPTPSACYRHSPPPHLLLVVTTCSLRRAHNLRPQDTASAPPAVKNVYCNLLNIPYFGESLLLLRLLTEKIPAGKCFGSSEAHVLLKWHMWTCQLKDSRQRLGGRCRTQESCLGSGFRGSLCPGQSSLPCNSPGGKHKTCGTTGSRRSITGSAHWWGEAGTKLIWLVSPASQCYVWVALQYWIRLTWWWLLSILVIQVMVVLVFLLKATGLLVLSWRCFASHQRGFFSAESSRKN